MFKKTLKKQLEAIVNLTSAQIQLKSDHGEIEGKVVFKQEKDGENEIEILKPIDQYTMEHIYIAFTLAKMLIRIMEYLVGKNFNDSSMVIINRKTVLVRRIKKGFMLNKGTIKCCFTMESLKTFIENQIEGRFLIFDLNIYNFYLNHRRQIEIKGYLGLVPMLESPKCNYCRAKVRFDFQHYLQYHSKRDYISHYICSNCGQAHPITNFREARYAYEVLKREAYDFINNQKYGYNFSNEKDVRELI